MTQAHINAVLPIKNRVLAADEHTAFLAHYDLNEHDVLRGVKAMGQPVCVQFNGDNQWADLGNAEDLNTFPKGLTVEFWGMQTRAETGDSWGLEKDYTGYRLWGSGAMSFMFMSPTQSWHSITGPSPTIGQWRHIAGVVDNVNLKAYLYIDGSLYSQLTLAAPINFARKAPANLDFSLKLGAHAANLDASHRLPIQMLNVGIWNTPRTQEQIKETMKNGLRGEQSGLVRWFSCDEKEPSVLRDSSPFHADGTIVGGVLSRGNSIFTMRPQEGRFGGAIAIEEGTTNIASYQVISGHGSSWVKTNEKLQENDVYRNTVTAPSTFNNFGFKSNTTQTIPSSTTHLTLSYWAKVVVSPTTYMSGYVQVAYTDGTNTNHTWGYDVDPYTSSDYINKWTKITGAVTLTAGKTPSAINLWYVYRDNMPQGTIDISMIQIEAKSFSTSFVNGTRPSGVLKCDMSSMGVDPLGDWTISGWFKRHKNVTGWASIFGIGNYYKAGEAEFTVWTNHSGRVLPHSHDNQSGGGNALITTNPGELEDWFFVAVTHKGSTGEFNIYLWTKDRYAKGAWTDVYQYPIEPTLYVGRSSDLSHMFNGLVDELRIDKIVRTEEEITAWYESNSPFWPRGIYRKSY